MPRLSVIFAFLATVLVAVACSSQVVPTLSGTIPTNAPILPSPTFTPASAPPVLLPTFTPTSAPPPPIVTATSAPLVPSPTPPIDARAQLLQLLTAIHSQFKIDPTLGCFELRDPYPDYHRGLEKMTALLVTSPLAQSFSWDERKAMFAQVTGFDGVRFIPGNGQATLVVLATNRGHNLGCGSHSASPDAFHIVDRTGAITEIDTAGLYANAWWLGDRWAILVKLKLDSISGPTPWELWQVGQNATGWQRVVKFAFDPPPYNVDSFPLRFENGAATMIADLTYWYQDDPCEFTDAFRTAYSHGDWQTRETYQLTGIDYKRLDTQVTDFPVYQKDTKTPAVVKWQDMCKGPISPRVGVK